MYYILYYLLFFDIIKHEARISHEKDIPDNNAHFLLVKVRSIPCIFSYRFAILRSYSLPTLRHKIKI